MGLLTAFQNADVDCVRPFKINSYQNKTPSYSIAAAYLIDANKDLGSPR